MRIVSSFKRYRARRWQAVAGPTYGAWLVDNEMAATRVALIAFACGMPVAIVLLLALLSPELRPVAFWLWPVLPLGMAGAWFLAVRRRNRLPLEIANDLWTRGFPTESLPSAYREVEFQIWAAINGATAEDLASIAQRPIVKDAPRRTAGLIPVTLKWSTGCGVAGVFALFFVVLLQIAFGFERPGAGTALMSSLAYVVIEVTVALWACIEVVNIYLAGRGGRLARRVASVQALVTLAIAAVWIVIAPSLVWICVPATLGVLVSLGLLWVRTSSDFVSATDTVKRNLQDAVNERRSAHPR